MQQQPITKEEFQRRIEPALRLFLSVDLENSTSAKQKPGAKGEKWFTQVLLFARDFPQLFEAKLQQHHREQKSVHGGADMEGPPQPPPAAPRLWKMLGDELIFVQRLWQGRDAHTYLEAFRAALAQWNADVASAGSQTAKSEEDKRSTLFVKGAAWLAGFPIANAVIDAGDGREDFVGPSIDAGFRIARLSARRRIPVSVDLAWLLLKAGSTLPLHFDGPVALKGVAEESGYPHLWLEVNESAYVKAERRMLGYESSREKMLELCELFIAEFGVPNHLPFLASDPAFSAPPDGYESKRQKQVEFLARDIYLVTGPEPEPKPGAGSGAGGEPEPDAEGDPDELVPEPSPSPEELLGTDWLKEEA